MKSKKLLLGSIPVLGLLFLSSCKQVKKPELIPVVKDVIVNVDIVNPGNISEETWNYRAGKEHAYTTYISDLIEKMKAGKLKAYSGIPNSPSDTIALTPDQIKSTLEPVDTVFAENPDNGEMESKVIQNVFSAEDISNIRFKENWFYDKEKSELIKEITAVQLCVLSFSENGELRGVRPLIWIKMSKPVVE